MKILLIVLAVISVIAIVGTIILNHPCFGRRMSRERKTRIEESPNYRNGQFQNQVPTPQFTGGKSMFKALWEFLSENKKDRVPKEAVPAVKTDLKTLTTDKDWLVWFGHSSYLFCLDGKRYLVDPVLKMEFPVSVMMHPFKGTDIELPSVQRNFLKALHEAGKRVVYVNCSGSAIALQPESAICDAIVQAWYAGEQGGTAIAEILYGDVNPSAKLPVTFYKSSSQLPDFEDYSMKGRTYRYFEDALFPFGYGLSYTTFEFGSPSYNGGKLSVEVSNTGKREGTEVVQLYLKNIADTEGPSKSLRGFQRITLKAGEHKTVTFSLSDEDFEWFDEQTNTMRPLQGEWRVMVGNSSKDGDLKSITITR